MRFHHYMAMHVATLITGPRHNYLAIVFAPEGETPEPQVVELPPQAGCEHRPLDPAAILAEVLAGVAEGNAEFGVGYDVQSVQFVRNDTGPEGVYRSMARAIVGDTKRFLTEEWASFQQLMARSDGAGDRAEPIAQADPRPPT